MDQGNNVDVILFFFTFLRHLTLCHDILLDKLRKLGITGKLFGLDKGVFKMLGHECGSRSTVKPSL